MFCRFCCIYIIIFFCSGLNDEETSKYLKSYEYGIHELEANSQLEDDMSAFIGLFNTQESSKQFEDDGEKDFISNLITQNDKSEENDKSLENIDSFPEISQDNFEPLEDDEKDFTNNIASQDVIVVGKGEVQKKYDLLPEETYCDLDRISQESNTYTPPEKKLKQGADPQNRIDNSNSVCTWDDIFGNYEDVSEKRGKMSGQKKGRTKSEMERNFGDAFSSDVNAQPVPKRRENSCASSIKNLMCLDFKIKHLLDDDDSD